MITLKLEKDLIEEERTKMKWHAFKMQKQVRIKTSMAVTYHTTAAAVTTLRKMLAVAADVVMGPLPLQHLSESTIATSFDWVAVLLLTKIAANSREDIIYLAYQGSLNLNA